MKTAPLTGKFAFWLLFALIFSSATLYAQSDFSADIVNDANSNAHNVTTIHVSKDKMRADPQQASGHGNGSVIVDFATGTTTVLMAERKMYMQMPPNQGFQRGFTPFRVGDVEDACTSWQKMATKPGGSCRKIGHASVNGRDTIEYEGKSADGEISHVWIDPKIAFPIKWDTSKGSSGELQNIQVGTQAASLFEVPAGYQKFDMGGMMPQMPQR